MTSWHANITLKGQWDWSFYEAVEGFLRREVGPSSWTVRLLDSDGSDDFESVQQARERCEELRTQPESLAAGPDLFSQDEVEPGFRITRLGDDVFAQIAITGSPQTVVVGLKHRLLEQIRRGAIATTMTLVEDEKNEPQAPAPSPLPSSPPPPSPVPAPRVPDSASSGPDRLRGFLSQPNPWVLYVVGGVAALVIGTGLLKLLGVLP